MLPNMIIWDWNGTLLDDWKLCFDIENEMLREHGMPEISEDWYLKHFSFPIKEYYRTMGYTFETESHKQLSEIFMERYNARCRQCSLRGGAIEALNRIRKRGIAQILLSVTRQDDLILQTQQFGAAACFSEILGQSDILGNSKTDRAKEYIRANGIDPKTVLFVGDTNHDFETAKAVGCECVLLSGGHQSKTVLQRCGAPVFDTIDAFLKQVNI